MFASIRAIEYHLPEARLTNEQLAALFPEWTAEGIFAKTGIAERRIAGANECASDLAAAAARKLFDSGVCRPTDIDFLLFCTECPDYTMPATACMLQHRLGLSNRTGALDFNLGCSGFMHGISLAKGLVETRQASNVLLLTADTVTKHVHPNDRGARALLGDAGTATLIQARADSSRAGEPWLGPFIFGTDGAGAVHLCVRAGGSRHRAEAQPSGVPFPDHLYMNGPEVFTFTLNVVPASIQDLLVRSETKLDAVDLFVFHQANGYMLEALRQKCQIPAEKFVLAMRDVGNTAASTIPIALKDAAARGQLRPGMHVMLVAFGTGYSWCGAMMRAGSGPLSA